MHKQSQHQFTSIPHKLRNDTTQATKHHHILNNLQHGSAVWAHIDKRINTKSHMLQRNHTLSATSHNTQSVLKDVKTAITQFTTCHHKLPIVTCTKCHYKLTTCHPHTFAHIPTYSNTVHTMLHIFTKCSHAFSHIHYAFANVITHSQTSPHI